MRTSNGIDAIDVLRIVRSSVNSAANQTEFARKAGVSKAHLSMMLSGHRQISDAVLRASGIQRRIVHHYEIIEQEQAYAVG